MPAGPSCPCERRGAFISPSLNRIEPNGFPLGSSSVPLAPLGPGSRARLSSTSRRRPPLCSWQDRETKAGRRFPALHASLVFHQAHALRCLSQSCVFLCAILLATHIAQERERQRKRARRKEESPGKDTGRWLSARCAPRVLRTGARRGLASGSRLTLPHAPQPAIPQYLLRL